MNFDFRWLRIYPASGGFRWSLSLWFSFPVPPSLAIAHVWRLWLVTPRRGVEYDPLWKRDSSAKKTLFRAVENRLGSISKEPDYF